MNIDDISLETNKTIKPPNLIHHKRKKKNKWKSTTQLPGEVHDGETERMTRNQLCDFSVKSSSLMSIHNAAHLLRSWFMTEAREEARRSFVLAVASNIAMEAAWNIASRSRLEWRIGMANLRSLEICSLQIGTLSRHLLSRLILRRLLWRTRQQRLRSGLGFGDERDTKERERDKSNRGREGAGLVSVMKKEKKTLKERVNVEKHIWLLQRHV